MQMKRFLLFSISILLGFSLMSQDCSDLFFSEYLEGSGNNKGLEIYNPTNQTIDLSKYWVARYSNGSSNYDAGGITQLEGFLLPHTTFILINGQTYTTETSPACNPAMQALADMLDHEYPAPTYMNGNDAIALLKAEDKVLANAAAVDLIGEIGLGDQIKAETGWSNIKDTTVSYTYQDTIPLQGKVINYIVQDLDINGQYFGPFWLSWTYNHTMIRKPSVKQGVKSNPVDFIVDQEWDTVGNNEWGYLGAHDCECASSGIYDQSVPATLRVSPNPVRSGTFSLYGTADITSIQILSISGRLLLVKRLSVSVRTTSITVADMNPGIYFIRAELAGSGGYITEKFILR